MGGVVEGEVDVGVGGCEGEGCGGFGHGGWGWEERLWGGRGGYGGRNRFRGVTQHVNHNDIWI